MNMLKLTTIVLIFISIASVISAQWTLVGPTKQSTGKYWSQPSAKGSAESLVLLNTTTALLGTCNGGIWKTTNFSPFSSSVNWRYVSTSNSCNSITSLSASPDDKTVIAAGCGSCSSYIKLSSEWTGPLLSRDQGQSFISPSGWTFGRRVSSVVVYGTNAGTIRIIASSDKFKTNWYNQANYAEWSSADAGGVFYADLPTGASSATWIQSYTTPVIAMKQHPLNRYIIGVTALPRLGSMNQHIIVSTDGGATFASQSIGVNIASTCYTYSSNYMNQPLQRASISFTATGGIYIIFSVKATTTSCYDMYYSGDSANTWTKLNTPVEGLGDQGTHHLYVAADPTDSSIFYLGGTAGKRFRGMRSGSVVNYVDISQSTLTRTAPHSDARNAIFYSNTVMCETNDGGISCVTNPKTFTTNSYEYWSLDANGDITTNEFTSISCDPISGAIVAGAQDNANLYLKGYANAYTSTWGVIGSGDGQKVFINKSTNGGPADVIGTAQQGFFFLGDTNTDASNFVDDPTLITNETWPFFTKYYFNVIDSTLFMICSDTKHCYLIDAVQTLKYTLSFSPEFYFYGGKLNGIEYSRVIFAMAQSQSGSTYYYWSVDHLNNRIETSASTPFDGYIMNVVQHPLNYRYLIATDLYSNIYLTTDFGVTWSKTKLNTYLLSATGATAAAAPWGLLILPVTYKAYSAIIVGTSRGVYVAFDDSTAASVTWRSLSVGIPNVFVTDFTYDDVHDTLYAATLGRSIWKVMNVQAKLVSLHDSVASSSSTGTSISSSSSTGASVSSTGSSASSSTGFISSSSTGSSPPSAKASCTSPECWKDLIVLDCNKNLHIVPSNDIIHLSINATVINNFYSFMLSKIQSRAQCHCPSLDTISLNDFFMPKFENILRIFDKVRVTNKPAQCSNNMFTDFKGTLNDALSSILMQLPSTCSYSTYMQKKQCATEINIKGLPAKLQLAVAQCPNDPTGSELPYISITCNGDLCSKMFQPCSTDDDCGSSGVKCSDINNGFTNNMQSYFTDFLSKINAYTSDPSRCSDPSYGGPATPLTFAKHISKYASCKMQSSSPQTTLNKVCGLDEFRLSGLWPQSYWYQTYWYGYYYYDYYDFSVDSYSKFISIIKNGVFWQKLMENLGIFVPATSTTSATVTNFVTWDGMINKTNVFDNSRLYGTYLPRVSVPTNVPKTSTDEVPLLHMDCSTRISIMPGHSLLQMNVQLPSIHEAINVLIGYVEQYVKSCRASISLDQFKARFNVFSLDFWLNLATSHGSVGLGADFPDFKTLMKGWSIDNKFGYDFMFRLLNMPSTCTYESYVKSGVCTFDYTGFSSLIGYSNVALRVTIQRCSQLLHAIPQITVSCVGSGCQSMFAIQKFKPCATDLDCTNNRKCITIDSSTYFKNVISNILWRNPLEDSSAFGNNDRCENNTAVLADFMAFIKKYSSEPVTDGSIPVNSLFGLGYCDMDIKIALSNANSNWATWKNQSYSEDDVTRSVVGMIPYATTSIKPANFDPTLSQCGLPTPVKYVYSAYSNCMMSNGQNCTTTNINAGVQTRSVKCVTDDQYQIEVDVNICSSWAHLPDPVLNNACIVPTCPNGNNSTNPALYVVIKIDKDFNSIPAGSIYRTNFINQFVQDIANALSIPQTNIVVNSLSAGSIIVNLTISGTSSISAETLVFNLKQQIANPNSLLYKGNVTSSVVANYIDPSYQFVTGQWGTCSSDCMQTRSVVCMSTSTSIVKLEMCSGIQPSASQSCCSSSISSSSSKVGLIAGIIGAIVGIIIIALVVKYIRSKKAFGMRLNDVEMQSNTTSV